MDEHDADRRAQAAPAAVDESIEAVAARLDGPVAEDVRALGRALAALARCDLAGAAQDGAPGGGLASAAALSVEALVRRTGEARRSLSSALRLAEGLSRAAVDLDATAAAGIEATEAAVGALEEAGPRTEDVAEVIDHLEDVASQAGVAALNVSVEVSRSGSEHGQALATLAEEVRRLADRSATVARRLAAAVEGLRSAWAGGARDLEAARQGQRAAHERAAAASGLSKDLLRALHEASSSLRAVRLPDDARASELALRATTLGDRLARDLEEMVSIGPSLPEDLAATLRHLEGTLRDLREQKA